MITRTDPMIDKRYLITLEGVSDDGIVIHKEAIIE